MTTMRKKSDVCADLWNTSFLGLIRDRNRMETLDREVISVWAN